METETMGKVLVTVMIENPMDLFELARGQLTDSQVRRILVTDAIVDTNVAGLLLPRRLIAELGLHPSFHVVRFTIQGRDTALDIVEVEDTSPVIIGRIPLLALDWVIDHEGHRLIGNPEHGGKDMIDVFQEGIIAWPS